ncbi:hypothetical protein BCR42DRAFT_400632 [Absidia repens]|uniref:Uncharacterized protein n=1 Tax=Absidia repens TaxID=90262 RepID=A0A1X2J1H7_9FUNG|nr:hypothetical protein BCR42DRAFT_400632 [Absidia repens]
MSMEKSFASLLRHSKLATYDRRLNQVYSTPKQRKQHGDWGLKRTLPTVIRTRYVTISDLDTLEHQTPWESGHSQVAFLQRWKENFGDTSTSRPTRQRHDLHQQQHHQKGAHEYHNLTSMTRSQFNHFIKHTITPETVNTLQQALRTNQITRDQIYDYLNISFRPEPSCVVGPIYSTNLAQLLSNNNNNDSEVVVEGRILNVQKGGYAVGIGGVVALLPKRFAVGIKKPGDRNLVRKLYVRRAYIDDQGKPQVIVSLQPKSESPSTRNIDLEHALSSPTSALPSSSPAKRSHAKAKTSRSNHWSTVTLDDLFATTPSNNIDDLQLFLLGQDNIGRTKRTHISPRSSDISLSSISPPTSSPTSLPPSLSSSSPLEQHSHQHKTKEELMEDHSIMMNRIIALLKNGTPNKE